MTDKQIIIDGVDVSGCGELYNRCCCDNGSFYCKDQPNCKFKLEKRGYKIEQITEFTSREELIETITHLRVLNAELESYNEQLKESQNIEIKENKILREQLKAKEQECEELKEWKETVKCLGNKTCVCKYINLENGHCSFYDKECIAINQCLYKNQQTLTEIKETAENCYDPADKENDGFWTILQKIREVEEVNNVK